MKTIPNKNNLLTEEVKTWLIEDEEKRHEKIQREVARYPRMARLMGIPFIDTGNFIVVDIGGGPVGLSSVIPHKVRIVIDPLTPEYAKYFTCTYHQEGSGEHIDYPDGFFDLAIITNALDHTDNPGQVIDEVKRILKPGGYFSHYHAIDNAITHKHPAHEHNINPEWLHDHLDQDFETVWELAYPDVRYGWHSYNGKVGQPAFCGTYRKVTGYGK